MALFLNLTGNVVNEQQQPITNFRYKGYHKTTGLWSDWYSSNNETQYNFNLGDSSWLTQDGIVKSGDIILIVIETLETEVTRRSFACIEIKVTDATSYFTDIQVKPNQYPNVDNLWEINSPSFNNTLYIDNTYPSRKIYIGNVNEEIIIKQNFNDNRTWSYKGILHYHVDKLHTANIFNDRIGISSILYDWDSGAYNTIDSYTFARSTNSASNGYIGIKTKVTNLAGLITYDTIYLQVRNPQPKLTLSYSPLLPTIKDELTINSVIDTENNTLLKVTYYFDNIKVTENTLTTYSWKQSLGVKYSNDKLIKAIVLWSNGFTSNTFEVVLNVIMKNLPPIFTLEQVNSTLDNNIRIACKNLSDSDGDASKVKLRWVLSYLTPLDNLYKTIYETDYPTIPNERYIDLPLTEYGTYKITCYGIDEYSAESSQSLEFTIDSNGSGGTGGMYVTFEWEE